MRKEPYKRVHIETIKQLFNIQKNKLRLNINKDNEKILISTKENPIKYGEKFYLKKWENGWGKLQDRSPRFIKFLEAVKIKYEIGNDAPRGGKAGDYIKILTKIRY